MKKQLNLITIEKDNHRNIYNVSLHKHNHFEIVYYISGDGNIVIDNKLYTFTSNTFSITRPRYSHREYSINNVSLIYIGFDCDPDDVEILKNGLYKCPTSVHLLPILKEIKYEQEQRSFYQEERMNYLLKSMILLVKRIIKMSKTKYFDLEDVKNYIKKNAHKNLTGIKLAKQFNYSYDYFRKTFKTYFQISINEFINKEKINLGINLLKKTDSSVAEIAKKCGFSSTSHFISTFKKYYKVTPKQFLLNYDKNAEVK